MRLRLSIAELVALAGVVIAGLTFWNSWSERRATADEKVAVAAGEARSRSRLDLTATPADRGDRLVLASGDHELSEVSVTFPRALGVPAQRPATPAIDSAWFRDELLRRTDGGPDAREGVLPVLVTARYWDGETARTTSSVYDLVWQTEGQLLRGRTLRLVSMRLRDRAGTQASLDRAWARTGL